MEKMESIRNAPDVRIDAAWIAARLEDPLVRIVEIDVSAAAYSGGHIPGGVLWNAYADLRHPGYRPIDTAQMQDLLCRSGISVETTVVVYGYAAHLGYWLLKSLGHERVRLLDGSREQWRAAGYDWSTAVPIPQRSQYPLSDQRLFCLSEDDVQLALGRPGPLLLDTRSNAEYVGERFWPSGAPQPAGRAGHIPGAVHLPIELLRTSEGHFRSIDEMRQVLAERDFTPEAEIVTYCTIGNRAAQAWFALHQLLGYHRVKVYYGSWAEWGMTADTPIET
ncbi:hypothetical protein BPNPMPFG_008415 (plasmid) [Mesorhizobium sp. AR07]|uniref:sulfurtransferase n=1 Tax=Mesorhizobium sp. AR07 TaxID=2865838 RepID=UPI00215EFCDF|nr:rhodanese-like domain-containing protein [Mesorhizobium sp. AR07]UVK49440.1 hypothetical protein BPNPMPFG_008415 [Mesorhizobium sp. AR07]